MWSRLTLTRPFFNHNPGDDDASTGFVPRYNIAPGQVHWMVRAVGRAPGWEAEVLRATWGLPGLTERPRVQISAEALSSRGVGRAARCVVPIDGFYGWRGEGPGSQVLWFHAPGAEVLWAGAICGLDADGTPAFALVTVPANATVCQAQERMPLLLERREVPLWLDPRAIDARLEALLVPAPPDLLMARPVSSRVRHVDVDDALCVAAPPEDTQLSLW